jgi:hypothetical protein
MKTYQKLASITAMAWATANTSLTVRAESATTEPTAEMVPAPVETNPHLTLCAMLGLKVGRTYEFMLTGNEEVHYWTIRSLGANGWILAKDSRYPATWVNLSQIIAVTPLPVRLAQERPKKANRDR